MIGDFGAEEAADAVERIRGGGEFVDEFIVVSEDHVESRVSERDAGELFNDVAEFGGSFLEEAAAGRGVEEQVVDFHHGAWGAAAFAVGDDASAVAFEFSSDGDVLGAGADAELGDGGDGSECFAAESEGADVVEVCVGANFAGRVAGDCEQHVVGVDAFAVIRDANEFEATGLDVDIDAGGEGVDAVFQQLFDHAAGALNDLPGGNAIDHVSIELLDACHIGDPLVACTVMIPVGIVTDFTFAHGG